MLNWCFWIFLRRLILLTQINYLLFCTIMVGGRVSWLLEVTLLTGCRLLRWGMYCRDRVELLLKFHNYQFRGISFLFCTPMYLFLPSNILCRWHASAVLFLQKWCWWYERDGHYRLNIFNVALSHSLRHAPFFLVHRSALLIMVISLCGWI